MSVTNMVLTNKEEVAKWLFEHAEIQGHLCRGLKAMIGDEEVNIAYVDTITKEVIKLHWETV